MQMPLLKTGMVTKQPPINILNKLHAPGMADTDSAHSYDSVV